MQIVAFGDGIHLNGSSGNRFLGNIIANCSWNGVYLNDSSHNVISGNNVTNNFFGIYIWYSSGNCVAGNNIADNKDGVIFYFSSGNGNGIYLFYASGNTIYHNNFINNTKHVFFYAGGYANVWHNGYPSGGNYWSNYTDIDIYSGPHQNETGSDGIWDHPYTIDGNNVDNYPLIPEFPTWTSMLLVLTIPIVAVVIYKQRLLKTSKH